MENYKITGDCVFYFRNMSTKNPTKVHIMNEKTGLTFCGWKGDSCTEILPNGESYFQAATYSSECCQKCLKAYEKTIKNSNL